MQYVHVISVALDVLEKVMTSHLTDIYYVVEVCSISGVSQDNIRSVRMEYQRALRTSGGAYQPVEEVSRVSSQFQTVCILYLEEALLMRSIVGP